MDVDCAKASVWYIVLSSCVVWKGDVGCEVEVSLSGGFTANFFGCE